MAHSRAKNALRQVHSSRGCSAYELTQKGLPSASSLRGDCVSRDDSQSPWPIDGVRKGRTSVQEEIEKVLLPALRCDAAKFVTAGCLFSGRLASPIIHTCPQLFVPLFFRSGPLLWKCRAGQAIGNKRSLRSQGSKRCRTFLHVITSCFDEQVMVLAFCRTRGYRCQDVGHGTTFCHGGAEHASCYA